MVQNGGVWAAGTVEDPEGYRVVGRVPKSSESPGEVNCLI